MGDIRWPPGPRRALVGGLIAPGRDPLRLLTNLARTYGDLSHFRMMGTDAVFVNHPQYIRDVLVTDARRFTKSRGLEKAKKLLGSGLLTSEGTDHLRSRRLLQPAFHRDRLTAYGATMVECADRARQRWAEGPIDIAREMARLTLAIVGRTLFSAEVEGEADEIGGALTRVLESFWLTLLPLSDFIELLPIPAVRRSHAARRRLDTLIYRMIAERRASAIDRGDVLSMLLSATDEDSSLPSTPLGTAPGFTDRQVRDEAMTLVLAGHETTANALMWTWYLLSGSPDVEARLHAEVDRVLNGRLPSTGDIPALWYVERIVTESMRLYPPAWVIGRRAIDAFAIGDYRLPARTVVFMSQWVTHRDARWFPDPDRFLPDRWTPEFRAGLPKLAYFPFGAGPRQCIGEAFAWMELVLLVATIAQRWSFSLVPGTAVAPQPLITLRAKHGMKMIARRL